LLKGKFRKKRYVFWEWLLKLIQMTWDILHV
jgi:hypothetical protein